jgi:phosphorylcholine phosphatase
VLTHWSDHMNARFETLSSTFSQDTPYAVFDADGTLWSHDLSESLLAYLESNHMISADRYKAEMFPIPIIKKESLFSYYLRLCDADKSLGYFWICQAFSGFSIGELKEHLDDLLLKKEPIACPSIRKDGSPIEIQIQPPAVFNEQRVLIRFLREKGIDVYVVTASQEELVRLIVSDTKYGFDIPPSKVIGMRLAVRSFDGKRLLAQHEKNLDQAYYQSRLTPSLSGLTTWYSGKVSAIKEYIDPIKKPVLAAGNSESDLAMLAYAETFPGIKLFVVSDEHPVASFNEKIHTRHAIKSPHRNLSLADQGWEFISLGHTRY